LGLRFDPGFWHGRHVLVTGHTGFKGAWLVALLHRLGASVSGIALPPEGDAPLCGILKTPLARETFADVRDAAAVSAFVAETKPEIILHMAAQALVRRSYAAPVDTFAVNVMGTAHVLEAARQTDSVRAALVITTDKVYENREQGRPFAEGDRLGANDPYSTSKAAAELVTEAYRIGFFEAEGRCAVATARSGNVIGGGDWSDDRIVPDIVRAVRAGEPVRLRYPDAVRPWLHVIETIGGYLSMTEALYGRVPGIAALNFAPDAKGSRTVSQLVERFLTAMGAQQGWVREAGAQPKESGLLTLSADAAARVLGWRPFLSFEETVDWTAQWYRDFLAGADMTTATERQIADYLDRVGAEANPVRAAS
jgi:CDP-glucose 4,6-dehydratase